MNKEPQDYKKFFTAECEITCLHCDFLMKRSPLAAADLLSLNKGLEFHVFLRKDKEYRCAEEGVELFFNSEKYGEFLSDFKAYAEEALTRFVPKWSAIPQTLSKEEFIEATDFLGKLWYFYGFTEFPFVDTAYEKAKNEGNEEVIKRLEDFGQFKFTGREILNAYWFEGGPIPNILLGLSNMFLANDDAKFLFLDELTSLFDGWRPEEELIANRRAYYGMNVTDTVTEILDFKETKDLYSLFTEVSSDNVIKGVIANKGKVTGKVIIAPMLNDHTLIAKLNAKMEVGDILVAESTSPDLMMLCRKASAIVADQGGMLSHAAIVSRELGIPCVIQAGAATRRLKDGDLVEVDADNGTITILKRSSN
ncbi:MAG: PEP-utilizing enzyme [Candidatus Paceibacterota bacterium]